MRWFLVIALLVSCGCLQAVEIPDNAVELRVALCPAPLADSVDPETFDQELTAEPFRLFANEDLTGPLGGLNAETAFGRTVSETVWGVLAVDFENTVCEVYANAETTTPL